MELGLFPPATRKDGVTLAFYKALESCHLPVVTVGRKDAKIDRRETVRVLLRSKGFLSQQVISEGLTE